MARRKKIQAAPTMPMETPVKMRRKWAAESMARTMMETDARHKKMEDHITKSVMAAGEKAVKKRM